MRFTKEELVELVERMHDGCPDAYAWLYTQAWALMLFEARKMDCLEDTYAFYTRLPHILSRFDPNEGSLTAFICRSVRGFIGKRHNTVKHQEPIYMDGGEVERMREQASVMPNIYFDETDPLERHKLHMWRALWEIDPTHMEVLVRHHLQGVTYAELGAEYGCTLQNVSIMEKRALRDVRIKMAATLNE